MIIGIGTDIVEVARISNLLKQKGFKEKVFTESEIMYCESKAFPHLHYAGRFAAKEAFIKASGFGEMNTIEIKTFENGCPFIIPSIGQTHVSISHERHYATAMVVIDL